MKVLALESATLSGGAALVDGERLLGEITLDVAVTHSERLMAAVDRLVAECGFSPRDLDGLAVSIGPGSFTGLRVGLATVKGLALALDVLAARLPFAEAAVCPILDARKGEVYLSLYRWDGQEMVRNWDYLALTPEAAAARLEAPIILLGDGIAACRPWLARLGDGCRVAPPAQRMPSPAVVAQIGRRMLAAGEGRGADEIAPLYLRPSEAELKARRAS